MGVSRSGAGELGKQYVAAEHEPVVWSRWLASGSFDADPARVLSGEAGAYTVLIPPPNVTAALHLGHALNNTVQDVLTRVHRMRGFEALWMPGTDHAGIATQTVVERRVLAEEGRRRTDFPREQFVAKIQAFKDEYEARITEQLKLMGCSCDWRRQRFTMDPVCARAVREGFFRLFEGGLIYRGKRLVNWDPVTQTALADDEVEMREVEGRFYYLRYPLVHRTEAGDHDPVTWGELAARGYPGAGEQPEDNQAWVTVATTRPETYLGDVAVGVNPMDARARALRGLLCELPLVGRTIPIIEDEYVVMPAEGDAEGNVPADADPKARFATGFLKVTPAHDPNDYELGIKHRADIEARCSAGEAFINVMAPDGSISASHGWPDYSARSGAHVFIGKSREEARALVVREFQAHGINSQPLLEAIKPYTHSVGHSYRSHAAIEPYLSDQWYCKVTDDRLRGHAQRALRRGQRSDASVAAWPESMPDPVGERHEGLMHGKRSTDGTMAFWPERYARTYEQWHDNLRDWCISRQLWWGHRIPVWSMAIEASPLDPGDPAEAVGFLDPEQRRAVAVRVDPVPGDGAIVHVCVRPGEEAIERALERQGFAQDVDVLDTWFSSALWPLSTLGWPAAGVGAAPPRVRAGQLTDDPRSLRLIYAKRVGTWRRFIGVEGEHSGDLIDRLLHLRDYARVADGPAEGLAPLVYQLFSEAELRDLGPRATPLTKPDDIARAADLLCVVGVRTLDPVATGKFGTFALDTFLLGHGFVEQDLASGDLLRAFNPTSVLCTAREIITLWVSRMVMFNRYFLARDGSADPGPPPFADVFIHAMIQDGEGRKMSKSLGNGVDPLDIIGSHGCDAMRYTLMKMTTHTQDVRVPVEPDARTGKNTSPKFDEGRLFCNKLWNAARFAISKLEATGGDAGGPAAAVPVEPTTLIDRWMVSRLIATIQQADAAVRGYLFSEYATSLYDLMWRDFCDWYLEGIKPTVAADRSQRAVLRVALDAILRLLHPIAPFITETIWHRVSALPLPAVAGLTLTPARKRDPFEPGDPGTLCTAGWPLAEASRDTQAEAAFERVRSLVEAVRQLRGQRQVPDKRLVTLHAPASMIESLAAHRGDALVRTLAGVGSITADPADPAAAPFTHDGTELHLSNLSDAVDAGAELARLRKERDELARKLDTFDKRLANPGYADRAPAHLVQQTRDERAATAAQLEALDQRLRGLHA